MSDAQDGPSTCRHPVRAQRVDSDGLRACAACGERWGNERCECNECAPDYDPEHDE